MNGNVNAARQRLTLSNLTEPQQMRELNRQLEWIWAQLMGGLSKKSLSSGLQSVIDGKADGETVTKLSTRIEQTEEEIALKASSETVNALGERVANAETSIVQNANSITSKASQSDVNALGERVASAETSIVQNANAITSKASQSDVNALGERVANAETSIVQNANSITSKASQSDVNALGERVTTAESEIRQTPDRISAAVSAVQVGGTNLVTLGNLRIVNAGGSTAVYLGKDWYRESEHQTTISPYSGVCWLQCPDILITAGRKYTLSYYAWIQPGAAAGDVKFRPNLWGGTSDTDKYLTGFIPFVIGTPTKYAVTFDTTGWTTGAYTLRFVMMEGQTHEVYFTDIKLEEGDKATAWSPNPNEVRIGSSILMDVNHTEISTPYLDIDVSGTDGDMHIDENGISAGTATFETLNCPDVTRYYTGPVSITLAAGADVSTLSKALSNRILTGDVTIGITGEVSGALELRGIGGYGRITINGGGNTLNGYINLYCNSVPIEINSVKVSRSTQRQCINVNDCVEVKTYGCVFNANASSGNAQGMRSSYSKLFVQNCEFYNIPDSAMAFSYGTDALVLSCKGAATYCFWYDGATLRVAGSRPSGICAGGNPSFLLPSDPSTVTVDTGSAMPAETPVTTASYTATTTGTYYPSGHWMSSNQMIQGRYDSTRYYGCMWFGASALSGKTIKSATLTIKRIAGAGKSSAVNVTLYTSPVTGKSGKPTTGAVSLGTLGKAANGESVIVTLPTSAIGVIAAGGALMLDPGDTVNASGKRYSSNYARFEGTDASAPVLTVTYQ